MSRARRVRVKALAKINLDLRVLGRRPDGYHELRTVFQTISLADTLEMAFLPGRDRRVELEDSAAIPDNLVVRAAEAVLDELAIGGTVRIRLEKLIPLGAGLGGGSSDAAAVVLALPVLAARKLPFERASAIAAGLGSDINFFLQGGTAVGIGRGTELFPMPDEPARAGVLIVPEVHVSTAEAYRDLGTRLTADIHRNKINSFQSRWWGGQGSAANDFEAVVFERHPSLADWKRRLEKAGAGPALMTGSGSVVFGLFPGREQARLALHRLGGVRALRFTTVGRAAYRRMWWKSLEPLSETKIWPPRSRYAR